MGTLLFFIGIVILVVAWNHENIGLSNWWSNALASIGIGLFFLSAWIGNHIIVAGICLILFVISVIQGFKDIQKHRG